MFIYACGDAAQDTASNLASMKLSFIIYFFKNLKIRILTHVDTNVTLVAYKLHINSDPATMWPVTSQKE